MEACAMAYNTSATKCYQNDYAAVMPTSRVCALALAEEMHLEPKPYLEAVQHFDDMRKQCSALNSKVCITGQHFVSCAVPRQRL
jgi:hypothetical protein